MGFHRKGQAESREGRSFPLPPPARRPHRAGPANRVPYPLQQPSGLMAKRAPPCALQPEGRPPLPCVTVTLHPFFSGQTEKPGELRADGHPPQNGNTQTFRANRAFPCPLQHRGRNGWTKKRGRSPLPPLMPPIRRPTHRLSNSAWSSGLTYICCSPTCCPSRQVHGIIVARSSRASISLPV